MRRIQFKFLVLLFFFVPMLCFGNKATVDSLLQELSMVTDEKEQIELLISITKGYQYFDLEKAIETGYKAQKLAKKVGDFERETQANLELSISLIFEGDFDTSIALVESNLKLRDKIKNKKYIADFLALAGYTYRRKGKSEKSLESYTQCLAFSKSIKYDNGIAQAEKGLGDLNERQGKYTEALENYATALAIAQAEKDYDLQSNIINATGIIYDYQGELQTALSYYIKALELSESIQNLSRASKIAANVGSLNFYMEHDIPAKEYYLKAFEMSKTTNNRDGQAAAAQGVTTVYNRMEDLENAKKYAKIDLDLRLEMGDTRGLVYAYKNLGSIYSKLENFDEAEKYNLLGLKYAVETDQKIKIAVLNLNMGRLMNQTNRPQKAIPYLNQTVEITKAINVKREESLAYEDLATAYFQLGNMKKAFEYQKAYSKLERELITERNNKESIKMQTAYEANAKGLKIELLEKESALNEQIIKKSNLVRNQSLFGVLFLFIVAGLFYNRSRIKQNANTLLKEKNNEIEKQNLVIQESLEVKETLLREIHHRVKNNLQIISSLLNLQSKKITNDSVLTSINEGKNRIEAMSLIHQNLYQTDKLTSINMNNYLEQLMNHLSRSFEKDNQKVKYTIGADQVSFDIDTAIPLGLIVNELVTNAYKHAFNEKDTGHINITIVDLDNEEYLLKVSDNGVGIAPDLDIKKTSSLGLKLVNSLGVKQLKGDMIIENNNGSHISIKFKDLKAAS